MIKKCEVCSKEFGGKGKNSRFCPDCAKRRFKKQQKDYRLRQGIEPRFEHRKSICLWCSSEFDFKIPQIIKDKIEKGTLTNFKQAFCSAQCQNAYFREDNLQQEEK